MVGTGQRKRALQRVFVFLLELCNYRCSKFRLQEEWLEQRQQVTGKCVDMRVKHLLCFASWWAEQSLQYCALLFIMRVRHGEWAVF